MSKWTTRILADYVGDMAQTGLEPAVAGAAANESDVIILRVTAWGLKEGRQRRVTYQLIDYRDLDTGLFAMNRAVGYTASIAAQMILKGQITAAGVLSPTRDVPPKDLLRELKARGMKIEHRVEDSEDL